MGSANNNAREIERRLSVEIEPDKAGIRVSGADEEAVDSALEATAPGGGGWGVGWRKAPCAR